MSKSGERSTPLNRVDSAPETEAQPPAKRARVAVACTRCKSRKQKCDGAQPKCGNCKNLPITCEYIVPSKTMPYGKYQYVKALEGRVADLELLMANAGLSDSRKDQWAEALRNYSFTEATSATQNSRSESQPGSSPSSSTMAQQEEPQIQEATQFLKDMSLQAGGGYVGAESSNVTLGHIFESLVRGRVPNADEAATRLTPKSVSYEETGAPEPEQGTNPLLTQSPDVADILLKGYLKHISTRWVVVYRPHIIQLHNNRATLESPYDVSTLNLAYAIAGRFLETTGAVGTFNSERHYQSALSQLELILQHQDIKAVQTLLLHAVHCLRSPRGFSAWKHVGLAIRMCIELGMHRKTYSGRHTLAIEIRKRVFWSCYCLDRQVSITLGRPFAISDRDIDVDLPLDVDDSLGDTAIQQIPLSLPSRPQHASTSLSCFIHVTRLRRIESQIQQAVYRVDQHALLPKLEIDQFLASLEEWKVRIPIDFSHQDTDVYAYEGHFYYEIYYYKCVRLLLFPQLSIPNVHTSTIVKCAEACGGVCRTYKQLHRKTSVGFSLMAFYSIFISGLTLLYCVWLSPTEICNVATSNDLDSCSIILYIITERWPGAKRYRDLFEIIKQGVLELVESGSRNMRVPLQNLDIQSGIQEMVQDPESLYIEARMEFGQMMSDMTGRRHPQLQVPVALSPLPTTPPNPNIMPQYHQQPQQQQQQQQIPIQNIYGMNPGPGDANIETLMFGNEMYDFQNMGNTSANTLDQMPAGQLDLGDDFDMGTLMGTEEYRNPM